MSYGQCIECGNDLVAHHGVDGLSIRCGHGERIAELEAEVARLTEEREVLKGWDDEDTTHFARSLIALRALVAEKDKALAVIEDMTTDYVATDKAAGHVA